MKKIVRLTESDLTRIVKHIITETDKEKILRSVVQGKQHKSRREEKSPMYYITVMDNYVGDIDFSEIDYAIRTLGRILDDAEKNLSDEEFNEVLEFHDDLVNQLNDNM